METAGTHAELLDQTISLVTLLIRGRCSIATRDKEILDSLLFLSKAISRVFFFLVTCLP